MFSLSVYMNHSYRNRNKKRGSLALSAHCFVAACNIGRPKVLLKQHKAKQWMPPCHRSRLLLNISDRKSTQRMEAECSLEVGCVSSHRGKKISLFHREDDNCAPTVPTSVNSVSIKASTFHPFTCPQILTSPSSLVQIFLHPVIVRED